MIFDGVNFNREVVSRMSEEEFIEKHIDYFWTRQDRKTRNRKLKEAYKLLTGKTSTEKPTARKKRKTES